MDSINFFARQAQHSCRKVSGAMVTGLCGEGGQTDTHTLTVSRLSLFVRPGWWSIHGSPCGMLVAVFLCVQECAPKTRASENEGSHQTTHIENERCRQFNGKGQNFIHKPLGPSLCIPSYLSLSLSLSLPLPFSLSFSLTQAIQWVKLCHRTVVRACNVDNIPLLQS